MCTVRIVMPCPGTLAPIASDTPSSGCTCTSSTFGRRPSEATSPNGGGGARLNWIAIVGSRRPRRFPPPPQNGVAPPRQPLPHPHVERRVRPAPVVDVQLRSDIRLGHRVRCDVLLFAVRDHFL